jgi:hypothetical protein
MMASKYGHPAIVRALVKARADPSICDKVSHLLTRQGLDLEW